MSGCPEPPEAPGRLGGPVRRDGRERSGRAGRAGRHRTGRTLPVYLSSGGKAVLATLDDDEPTAVPEPLDASMAARLVLELRTVRRHGFAAPPAGGFDGAALSLAALTFRYSRDRLQVWATALGAAPMRRR